MTEERDNDGSPLERVVSLRAHKMIADSHHDLIVTMQAAWIEWQHGCGAEAAMQWIENTLDGPGLIPDETEPYGKEAQFYHSANCAHPMGPCAICGKPSSTAGSGISACSYEHFKEALAKANA